MHSLKHKTKTILLLRSILYNIALYGALFVTMSLIIFVAVSSLSGDASSLVSGINGDNQTIKESLGLNQSTTMQYIQWLRLILNGDFGISLVSEQPVMDTIIERGKVSSLLMVFALLISIVVGVSVGLMQAIKKAWLRTVFISTLIATPPIWLSFLSLRFLAVELQWFPVGGNDDINSYILPCLVLGLGQSVITARYVYVMIESIKNSDFIVFARLRGLSLRHALTKHGLSTVSPPIIEILSLQIASLITGSVIVEQIFNMSGLGSLLIQSISNRDTPMVSGIVVITFGVTLCILALSTFSVKVIKNITQQ